MFAGHDHVYARIHTDGIVYFLNGLGGENIAAFGGSSAAAFRYNSDYGAMRLEATDTNLVFHFITRANVVVDSYVLGAPIWSPFILARPLDQTTLAGRGRYRRVRIPEWATAARRKRPCRGRSR